MARDPIECGGELLGNLKKEVQALHTTPRKPVRRVLTALVMAALIILAILFITPQGRSLALADLLHFFTH